MPARNEETIRLDEARDSKAPLKKRGSSGTQKG